MKKCRNCGKQIPDTALFCKFCGQNIESESYKDTYSKVCSHCNNVNSMEHNFCKYCGYSLEPLDTSTKVKTKHIWKKVLLSVLVFVVTLLFVIGIRNVIFDGNADEALSAENLEMIGIQFDGSGDFLEKYESGLWPEMHEVSVSQACRISFELNPHNKEYNLEKITVTDTEGTLVDVDISVEDNIVTIQPSQSYLPGHFYQINIDASFQTQKGITLADAETFVFSTQPSEISTLLTSEKVQPSDSKQRVVTPEGAALVIPGGLFSEEKTVEIKMIQGAMEQISTIDQVQLAVYELSISEERLFKQPLFIELPVDFSQVETEIPSEFVFKTSYWDEIIYRWVDAPCMIDKENSRLIIPTYHLTKWSVNAIKADGHIYNEYFSLYYSSDEMKQYEAGLMPFDSAVYIDEVFDAFNEVKEKYEKAGFRPLEKIQGVQEVYLEEYPQAIQVPYYNIYLTGNVKDVNASRSKYTGSITIPVDDAFKFNGVNYFQIAHELFHNFQNRYYYAIGMSEFGTPFTTAPSDQFLIRQWWLEASADYAAGRIAYPNGDRPNKDMGGIISAKHLEKPLIYSPSSLTFWSPEDRHSYNNAWLFEFLVTEKGIDFKDMFETVASYYNPSIYSNFVSYLLTKQLDINEVYSDYAKWWFSNPVSPLSDTARESAIDKKLELSFPAAATYSFSFLATLGGSGIDNLQTTKAIKFVFNDAKKESRILILSSPNRDSWEELHHFRIFSLPGDKKQVVMDDKMTKDTIYLVKKLQAEDPLYVLSVNNKGDVWDQSIRVDEVEFICTYEKTETGYEFTGEAGNIPLFIGEDLTVTWVVDEKPALVDDTPIISQQEDALEVVSVFTMNEIEEHEIKVILTTGKQEQIAEILVKEVTTTLKIKPDAIDNGTFGVEYDFEFEAAGIPRSINDVVFEWNMGDSGKDSIGEVTASAEGGKAKISIPYTFSNPEEGEEQVDFIVHVVLKDAATGKELVQSQASMQFLSTTVIIQAPRSMTYELQGGASEVMHTFEAYVKNPVMNQYMFLWNFGDESAVEQSIGQKATISHTYTKIGKYYPSVAIYTMDGDFVSEDRIMVELTQGKQTSTSGEFNPDEAFFQIMKEDGSPTEYVYSFVDGHVVQGRWDQVKMFFEDGIFLDKNYIAFGTYEYDTGKQTYYGELEDDGAFSGVVQGEWINLYNADNTYLANAVLLSESRPYMQKDYWSNIPPSNDSIIPEGD